VCALALGAVAGCRQRTLSEADCTLVKDRLESAWDRDAAAAARLAGREQLGPFIRDHGDQIGDTWMDRCRPMIGSAIDEAEYDCLVASETIDDVYECAPR
jgi:hypothetical protein